MSARKTSDLPHITVKEVPDIFVTELYDARIANDWVPPTDLIKSPERIALNIRQHGDSLVSDRRIDFYRAANGSKGIEFTTKDYSVRLFLSPDRREGFKSAFYTKSGVGVLETFNVAGASERMSGRWMADEKTGLQVFIKDEIQRPHIHEVLNDDPIKPYNHGYHLSRFMNRHWPKKDQEPS